MWQRDRTVSAAPAASGGASDSRQSLARFDLFEGLDDAALRRVESRCRWRRYRAGDTIVERNDTSRDLFLVAEGAVCVMNEGPGGREVAFADLGTGEYFGELAAIDALPRTAAVKASENSLLAILPPDVFVELLRDNASVSFRVVERLVSVIRISDIRITDLATLGAMERVYAELLRLAVPDAAVRNQWVVRPCPTERELASRTGTSRETVARAIRQIREADLVRKKDRKLYILDRARLESIAQSPVKSRR